MTMRRGDVLVLDRFVPYRPLPVTGSTGRWAVILRIGTASAAFLASGNGTGWNESTTLRG